MDPVAITALILSVISIILWAYTFLFSGKAGNLISTLTGSKPESTEKKEEPSLPVRAQPDSPPHVPARSSAAVSQESQFMSDTQKFSQMVHKNLEILNTRVGVKFSVKPLPEEYSSKRKGPDYIDSMDVTEESNDRMLTDESSD